MRLAPRLISTRVLTAVGLCAAFIAPASPIGALSRQPEPITQHAQLEYFESTAEKPSLGWETLHAQRLDQSKGLVLLIHGLDEPGTVWDTMAPALTAQGYTVVRFEYPNDQAIANSAEAFNLSLTQLGNSGVTDITLVAHSMGGLVSMDALTRPDMDRSNWPTVRRLITLGTPTQGSALAPFRAVAEIREHAMRVFEDGAIGFDDLARVDGDGQGQAGTDLTPGSAFLVDLNARTPPDVEITSVVGKIDTVSGNEFRDHILANLPSQISDDEATVVLASDFGNWAAGIFKRASTAIGDGVVTSESASSPWTEDIVFVKATHRSMVTDIPCPVRGKNPPPAIDIVLDRLGSDREE
jgi:pimeloyl-ACP methyl ester carboxylesterase